MKIKAVFIFIFLAISNFIFSRDSITLYLFLLDDCVICQSYTPKINNLHSEYGDEITFIGMFPNFSSKPKKISSYKKKFNIIFETKTDYWKSVTKKFEVSVTPEVVVYNETTEEILYKGRIDNEFAALGKRRRVISTDELAAVLSKIKSGEIKKFPFTEAVGCFINQNDPTN